MPLISQNEPEVLMAKRPAAELGPRALYVVANGIPGRHEASACSRRYADSAFRPGEIPPLLLPANAFTPVSVAQVPSRPPVL